MGYVSELGRKFGEEHHAAKLSDVDVERVRALSEHGVPYRVIGVVYGMSEDGVAKICRYERRNVVVAKWKKGGGA